MSMPLIVTHPSTIFHDGLRRLFSAKSGYRPVRIATALTPDLESYIGTLESCVWLAGVESCMSTINPLIRKLLAANPNVKVVVLSGTIESADIMAALAGGSLRLSVPKYSWRNASQIPRIDHARANDRASASRLASADCQRRTANGWDRWLYRLWLSSARQPGSVAVSSEQATAKRRTINRRATFRPCLGARC